LGGALVGNDETTGRKKYWAPRLTQVATTSLSPRMRGELAHLMAETSFEIEPDGGPKDEFHVVLNLEGRFQRVSEEFCSLVGYAQDELLGKRIDEVTASRTVHLSQHLETVVHFGQVRCLWMFVHRDGRGVLVRSDWELFPDVSLELRCELLRIK
jgi:PAS domain-containing protein